MSKYRAFAYMAFTATVVFAVAAFSAYPYIYLPMAGGCGYLGYKLYKRG